MKKLRCRVCHRPHPDRKGICNTCRRMLEDFEKAHVQQDVAHLQRMGLRRGRR